VVCDRQVHTYKRKAEQPELFAAPASVSERYGLTVSNQFSCHYTWWQAQDTISILRAEVIRVEQSAEAEKLTLQREVDKLRRDKKDLELK